MAGKLRIAAQKQWEFHRSGWKYALAALDPLKNVQGVRFEGSVDEIFGWSLEQAVAERKVPIHEAWIGVLHQPPQLAPPWYPARSSLTNMLGCPEFIDSLASCQGLLVLSQYLATWLRTVLPAEIRVSAVAHPTEIPDKLWEARRFSRRKERRVVQLGHHLRRMTSITRLGQVGLTKTLLWSGDWARTLYERECDYLRWREGAAPDAQRAGVEFVDWMDNDAYDRLLSESVAFTDLYDASANNAVIECLARGTPLVVNHHPAVVEYLGKDYPLYFTSLKEAASKLQDTKLLTAGHDYMMHCSTRKLLSAAAWRKAVELSEVYQQAKPVQVGESPVSSDWGGAAKGPVIKYAFYGSGANWVDVTTELRRIHGENRESVLASNRLAGDPCIGNAKRLLMLYQGSQGVKLREVHEGQELPLP